MGGPHSIFVLALGSFGCVGVGLLAECVTAFKPEVVSFVEAFVSELPSMSVFDRGAPLGVSTGVGICDDARIVLFLDEAVVFPRGTLFSFIITERDTIQSKSSHNKISIKLG